MAAILSMMVMVECYMAFAVINLHQTSLKVHLVIFLHFSGLAVHY